MGSLIECGQILGVLYQAGTDSLVHEIGKRKAQTARFGLQGLMQLGIEVNGSSSRRHAHKP
ncbi:MAG TPA: hypothetical protein VMW27_13165 [Thermoanaerobaculia bacterium]|nr:hypothetical protein [Thermoanaerobaculia bacterium]